MHFQNKYAFRVFSELFGLFCRYPEAAIGGERDARPESKFVPERMTVVRWLGRWLVRTFLFLAAATLVAYVADTLVYMMRGSPSSTVTISRFMGVPLKGQKEEYDYLGSEQVPCAVALFPHKGQDPCWHLRRNPNEWENL